MTIEVLWNATYTLDVVPTPLRGLIRGSVSRPTTVPRVFFASAGISRMFIALITEFARFIHTRLVRGLVVRVGRVNPPCQPYGTLVAEPMLDVA